MSSKMTSFASRASRAGVLAAILALGLAMMVPDAEARRLGGGKSFGRQSQNVDRSAPPARDAGATSQQSAQGQPGGAAQQPRNRFGGMLGGLAAGLGIAALLSYLGLAGPLAEMLGSVLMVGLLVGGGLLIWRMLRGARNPAPAGPAMEPALSTLRTGTGAARPGSVAASLQGSGGGEPLAAPAANWSIPSDFDTQGFLRQAKVHYLRLQAAWDARNLDDVREFTTPEVFAEIRMQLAEETSTERTDIEDLEAQLLGIETGERDYLASVRFTGMAREQGGTAERFAEVWNLSKPARGKGGWLLAGIQQA